MLISSAESSVEMVMAIEAANKTSSLPGGQEGIPSPTFKGGRVVLGCVCAGTHFFSCEQSSSKTDVLIIDLLNSRKKMLRQTKSSLERVVKK